ncbi:MAG: AAA family ATPase [Gemmatimonadales bacterium]|nr:AAA family ATPase [Gemmatimonadales bacterium]NIQ98646.1 AAA family ATPase [Gemmatimonadales bacterium]
MTEPRAVFDEHAYRATIDERRRMTVGGSPPTDDGSPAPVLVNATHVELKPIQWLWSHRIPLGKLTFISGDPDLGKSSTALDIAARLTRGDVMPDQAPTEQPAGVVMLTAEDAASDTVIPRLMAAGANLERVKLLNEVRIGDKRQEIVLPEHLDALLVAVEAAEAKLVIVDVFTAFLTGTVNTWRDHDLRRALRPLAKFAEESGVAVVAIRHLTKQAGTKAIYRGGGSIAFSGAARAEYLVASDPEDDTVRIFATIKNNLAPKSPSLRFRLEGVTVPGLEEAVVKVTWLGESPHTADSLVEDPTERSALGEAKEFLRDQVQDGPRLAEEIIRNAKKAGISESTLKRAKRELKVKSQRMGFGPGGQWMWELPSSQKSYEEVERAAIQGDDAA